jgi:hypothetical protein
MKGLGEQTGEVPEVVAEVHFCCRSLVARLDSHSKGEVVPHSCIRRQSIGRFRDETAEPWAVDSLIVGLLRQSEAAVSVGLAVAGKDGLLMRCETPNREEHNLVVEA